MLRMRECKRCKKPVLRTESLRLGRTSLMLVSLMTMSSRTYLILLLPCKVNLSYLTTLQKRGFVVLGNNGSVIFLVLKLKLYGLKR